MLITRNPRWPELAEWEDMTGLSNRLARLLNLPFPTRFGPEPGVFTPVLDVAEFDDHLKITAELPGLKKDQVAIEIDQGVLMIRGEKKERKEEKTDKMYLLERSYGMFERSFTLPPSIDAEKVKAEFENGVLSITLPKLAAKNGRKVDILEK